ncbi:MAG: hypothetical protein JKY51_10320, partial [Opitutaceae bacterium]|nr:hypothetical protein [Opitutaceae bacterium]
MTEEIKESLSIDWHRTKLDRKVMKDLNQRSDWKGFFQAGGHLGILLLTGATLLFSADRLPLFIVLLLIFFHGICYAFLRNGFHELAHRTVFTSKRL